MLLPILLLLVPPSASAWDVIFVNVFATHSHQTVAGYTANVLADHGHSVTYVSTNVPSYLREQISKHTLTENEKIVQGTIKELIGDDPEPSFVKALPKIKLMLSMCGSFFRDPYVQRLIQTGAKFDVMVAFGALYDSCAFALAHKLGIPGRVVQFPAPCTFAAQISAWGLPIYHSSVNHNGMTYQSAELVKASPLLRAKNLLQTGVIRVFESLVQRIMIAPDIYPHVPDYPGAHALFQQVHLVLMHYHPLTDDPVPFGPGVVPLAGTLCSGGHRREELGEELGSWVDESEGFVYLSFGSVIGQILEEEVEMLKSAFARLPFRVVWKVKQEVSNLPANVKTFPWLPQVTLLQHPKLRVFITHGGYASKVEAMCAGVPMLVMPRVAFDQFLAADQVAARGLGDKITNLNGSSAAEVYDKIMLVSGEEMTGNSRDMRRQLMATRTTEKQLVGYFDMVVTGMRLLPGYQPWWEYWYLDLVLVPLAAILLIRWAVRKIRGRG